MVSQNRDVATRLLRRSPALWLALPVFLVLMVLIGMAVSAESRSEFEERQAEAERQNREQAGGEQGAEAGQGADPSDRGRDAGDPSRFGEGNPTRLGDADIGDVSEIAIVTEDGDVFIVRIDEDGQPVVVTPAGDGSAIEFDPDDAVGIRLDENGQLEIVPIDEIGPDDTVVVPTQGGFDLIRPDGSTVEFRRDGENGGVTATEVSADGRELELEPNPDGSVTLSDGTTIGPIDVPDDPGMFEDIIDRTRGLPWPWLVAAAVLVAALSIGTAVYLLRKRPDEFDLAGLVGANVPEDRFEAFLQSLLTDPDPTRAIRLGFSLAEQGLGGAPARRGTETPFEWHQKVEATRPDLAPSVGRICDLFALARFAPGQASDQDRRAMVDALRQLQELGRRPADSADEPVVTP